jgi:adenylate cyclase
MRLPRYTRRKIIFIGAMSMVGLALGTVFALVISADPTVKTAMQGGLCGFIIGLLVFYLEYFAFYKIRKVSIYIIILSKTFLYGLVIVIAYSLSDLVVFGYGSLVNDMKNYLLPSFSFALISVFAFIFIVDVNRLLGQKALVRLLIGLYHTPSVEKRIFMFLDLVSSTSIAEEIGDIKFHSFLNDFFFDVTEPILESRGEIYKYVGDEIIVTWTMKAGLRDGNCINCFFHIEDKIEGVKERYLEKYGVVPEFSAGIHCGSTVVGEMGDFKREVAYLGDAVNTASRIQSECKYQEKNLIISDTLKKLFDAGNAPGISFRTLGSITLRGKKSEIELFYVFRD